MRSLDVPRDDESFAELAAVSEAAHLTPAEFVRRAATLAIRSYKARSAAQRDEIGYATQPIGSEEFSIDPADLQRADDEAW
jgi:hypothetical protein